MTLIRHSRPCQLPANRIESTYQASTLTAQTSTGFLVRAFWFTSSCIGLRSVHIGRLKYGIPEQFTAAAMKLMEALKASAGANGNDTPPSPQLLRLIKDLEERDPNGADEDNSNESWGHEQYTNWRQHLSSWADVGSLAVAARLIAAALKTCLVARHCCFLRDSLSSSPALAPGSFLCDAYLRNVAEQLLELYEATVGNKKTYSLTTLAHKHFTDSQQWPRCGWHGYR